MEKELKIFIKVWASAIISVSYCYYLLPGIKAGLLRLVPVIPICALFFVLPLFFSSMHFTFTTLFFLTWLANIRLILFAFDRGPLFPLPSNLIRFICFTCLPIKLQRSPKSHSSQNLLPEWFFGIKVATFGVLVTFDGYIKNLHPILLLGFHPLHVYLYLDILLALIKYLVTFTLGCELEPQFNEPYLATSLQDFWGRRWNLMVSSSLRSGVYTPVRRVCERLMSSDHAILMGFLASFIVSGVFHELMFFYITHDTPSWEVTVFSVLNGVCTVLEMAAKRTKFVQRWQVSPVVSWLLTMGFLVLTSALLLFRN